MEQFIDESATFEAVMMGAADSIIGEETQKTYRKVFSRDYLLKQAAEGNMPVQLDYLVKLEEKHYEWVTAVIDMVQNPVNGEIGGVAYSKSCQISRMTDLLLEKTLEQDYMFAAVIFSDTDEFYLYSSFEGRFKQRMEDYWQVAIKDAQPKCSDETMEQLKKIFAKENVIKHLETKPEYRFAYDSTFMGQQLRLEIRFSYMDDSRKMILASMRNITDSALFEQFRQRIPLERDSLQT